MHLMSLCASMDQGVPGERLRSLLGVWTDREYPARAGPPERFEVTARDVVDAEQADRPAAVKDWASATWSAWGAHHGEVRAWLAEANRGNH
ncbi:MAG: DUF5946 family protein [Acidimicrobiales bacterium]